MLSSEHPLARTQEFVVAQGKAKSAVMNRRHLKSKQRSTLTAWTLVAVYAVVSAALATMFYHSELSSRYSLMSAIAQIDSVTQLASRSLDYGSIVVAAEEPIERRRRALILWEEATNEITTGFSRLVTAVPDVVSDPKWMQLRIDAYQSYLSITRPLLVDAVTSELSSIDPAEARSRYDEHYAAHREFTDALTQSNNDLHAASQQATDKTVLTIVSLIIGLGLLTTAVLAAITGRSSQRHSANERALLRSAIVHPGTGLLNSRGFGEALAKMFEDPGGSPFRFAARIHLDQADVLANSSNSGSLPFYMRQAAKKISELTAHRVIIAYQSDESLEVLFEGMLRAEIESTARELVIAGRELAVDYCESVLQSTWSIGIVDCHSAQDPNDVQRTCSLVCMVTREQGGDDSRFADPHDIAESNTRNRIENCMRASMLLHDEGFSLVFQRIQSLSTESEFCEILLREKLPSGILVPPGSLIDAAEEFGTIKSIDRWVLNRTLSSMGCGPLSSFERVFVNISRVSLACPDFGAELLELLKEYPQLANRLVLEITETAVSKSLPRVRSLLISAKSLGCMFALDDFGTGSSSFKCLKGLPIDFVKIDGTFIRRIHIDEVNQSISRAIIEVAKSLGSSVIGKCVENLEQKTLLQDMGVDFVQGFAIHRPVELLTAANESFSEQRSANAEHALLAGENVAVSHTSIMKVL